MGTFIFLVYGLQLFFRGYGLRDARGRAICVCCRRLNVLKRQQRARASLKHLGCRNAASSHAT